MKKSFSILLIMFTSLFWLGTVFATGNDDHGQANDPNENDRANACYDEGTMAGKCDTDWEWTCGWFMIRFDVGIFSRRDIPASCTSLLPVEIDRTEVVIDLGTWPPAGCYPSDVYVGLWIIWDGNQTQMPPINLTWEVPCGAPTTGVGGFFMVSAPDAASANAICTSYGYNFVDEISSSANTGAWPIYRCQIP